MKTEFSQDWQDWIRINLKAGCNPDGIFKILLDEGYSYDAVVKQMGYQPRRPASTLNNPLKNSNGDQAKVVARESSLSRVDINGAAIRKQTIKTPRARSLERSDIDLRVVDNFLSKGECDKLSALIKSQLRPSELSNAVIDRAYRSSRSCQLGLMRNQFIDQVDVRICKLIGLHRAYSEVLQGQYYQPGEEFKAHTDFFNEYEFAANCSEFGQRTFTVMIYLNSVIKGGETCFLNIRKNFKPKQGTALIWNNLNPDGSPNTNTLHKANMVEEGEKLIVTKWFRSKPAKGYEYLKMLTKKVNDF